MASKTDHVTEEQREQLDRDGYLVFDPEIPDSVLNGVLADLESRYLGEADGPVLKDGVFYYPHVKRIRDAWHISENAKAIALAPKVLGMLEGLYGRAPLCFQTLNFAAATQQAPHSDSMHFSPSEPEYMCGVWVALEDIDMDNGPLIYYPGSHKLPFLDYDDIDFESRPEQYKEKTHLYSAARNREYEAHVAGLIEQHGFEPKYATIQRGEAMIWSANLLHGGAPLRDPSRTRHSQVSHYLFEGATGYYTAMVSGPDFRVWNEPTWLTP
jgi:hypothetical protein